MSTVADGREVCNAGLAEIETYARQIMEQLALIMHSPPTPPPSAESLPVTDDGPAKAYSIPEIRKQHRNAYMKWTEDDDVRLGMRFGEGATVKKLADEFGRQTGGIRCRLLKLGLISRPDR